ncbi:MAG TPA: hypothetical protein DEB24_06780 [Coriobacteriia bacterium]|nr:hypothetical protein [Coriobacteriia bacterium]
MHIGRQYDDDYNAIIPDDCFTCGMGLYVSLPYGYGDELLVLEVVDLGGQKLGKGREDYCFLVAPDMLSPIKARKRREEGQTDISGLNDPKSRGMRSLWEIEESALGCRVTEHEAARSGLFYHEVV